MVSSRIIKHWVPSSEAYELVPQPSRHDQRLAIALLNEARERAAKIVADAEAQAAAIRERAEREHAQEVEALRATLMAQAREEARAEQAAQMDALQARFAALVEQAIVTEQELRRAYQADLLALAVALAERILGREIATDPSVLERMLSVAIAHAQGSTITQIMVHPDDLELAEQYIEPILSASHEGVEIVADPHVTRGGCVIGTRTGFIDARIDTQLAEARAVLAEVIEDE